MTHQDSAPQDAALASDEARTSELYAQKYLEQGRNAAALIPELRAAVAMESYIERKFRRALGNDPAIIRRAMADTRNQIADLIRAGADLSELHMADQLIKLPELGELDGYPTGQKRRPASRRPARRKSRSWS